MADNPPIQFRDQRQGQRPGGAQGIDHKMLGLVAYFEGLESLDGYFPDLIQISAGFVSNNEIRFHLSLHESFRFN